MEKISNSKKRTCAYQTNIHVQTQRKSDICRKAFSFLLFPLLSGINLVSFSEMGVEFIPVCGRGNGAANEPKLTRSILLIRL